MMLVLNLAQKPGFLTPNGRSVLRAGVSLNIHSFIHSKTRFRYHNRINCRTINTVDVGYFRHGSIKDPIQGRLSWTKSPTLPKIRSADLPY